jgi:phosphoglycerate dehydrogenase-like enzyme
MKVLANDGISKSGIEALEKGGFEVITTKVAQEQVANYINTHDVQVILVRSATKVRQDIIDACPGLKIIGRGGVGMDNIDVDEKIILTSDGIDNIDDFPKSLVIVGAGVIGCEYATIFSNFGKTKVYIIVSNN